MFLFIFNVLNHELPLSFINSHVDGEQVFENVWCKQSRRQRKHFLTERNKAALPKTSEMHFFHLVGNRRSERVPSSYLLAFSFSFY